PNTARPLLRKRRANDSCSSKRKASRCRMSRCRLSPRRRLPTFRRASRRRSFSRHTNCPILPIDAVAKTEPPTRPVYQTANVRVQVLAVPVLIQKDSPTLGANKGDQELPRQVYDSYAPAALL